MTRWLLDARGRHWKRTLVALLVSPLAAILLMPLLGLQGDLPSAIMCCASAGTAMWIMTGQGALGRASKGWTLWLLGALLLGGLTARSAASFWAGGILGLWLNDPDDHLPLWALAGMPVVSGAMTWACGLRAGVALGEALSVLVLLLALSGGKRVWLRRGGG